ncbi:MAG: C39 family peptidase [Bacteroidetes bacterium]|nr:C39 family peptidase [Bacteroidota bacterium]
MKKLFLLPIIVLFFYSFAFSQFEHQTLEQFITKRFKDPQGKEINQVVVPGKPPKDYRAPSCYMKSGSVVLNNVPAFSWSFGCSPTAASMAAGYYDNHGYANMYTGPTNGGVMPMTNASWGSVIINGESRDLCPLSATGMNIDGRLTRGHIDDYWILYGNNDPDPYLTNGWVEHEQGECLADYMGSNKSVLGNSDGSTSFVYYTDGSPIYDYSSGEPGYRDGCHGMRLFYQSRGYTVVENYTQLIYGVDGNTLGFTFEQYKNEIDNGRPVLIQVTGHTMLGFGYDDLGSTVYVHDTWDYSNHSMTWGGSYAGLNQWGVTVVQLLSNNSNPVTNFTGSPTTVTAGGNVSFSDLSAGNPTSWAWSFPGGIPATSALRNPVVAYNVPGSYDVSLVATNSNGSTAETKVNYILVSEQSYCHASGACDEYISELHLGNINNLSSCGTNGYTDYTGISTVLVAGQTYTISVVNGNPYTDDQCGVWIDWNKDTDFDDAGEFVTMVNSPGGGPYSATFTVPAGATLGNTRLRARILYSGSIVPCGQVDWGETEDYTVCILPNSTSKVLNLKVFLQGLYIESSGEMSQAKDASGNHFTGTIADQLTVKLTQVSSPFTIIAQVANVNLDKSGNCTAILPSSVNGDYYIVVNHRNSIATWSATPVSFTGDAASYNFTLNNASAYGNNLVLSGTKYCLFGGDVNQDGQVNSLDISAVNTSCLLFSFGYLPQDANGDGIVDYQDLVIVDNNAANMVAIIKP